MYSVLSLAVVAAAVAANAQDLTRFVLPGVS